MRRSELLVSFDIEHADAGFAFCIVTHCANDCFGQVIRQGDFCLDVSGRAVRLLDFSSVQACHNAWNGSSSHVEQQAPACKQLLTTMLSFNPFGTCFVS